MGPCLAPGGTPSTGGQHPGGTNGGETGAVSQPPNTSLSSCPAESQDVSSTAWVHEADHVLDYEALGQTYVYENSGSADPRVVQLDDGRYRMYFANMSVFDGASTALSWDGIEWEVEAIGVLPVGLPHTTLLRLPDGGWRIYSSQQQAGNKSDVLSFTSPDGLVFTPDPGVRLTDGDFPGGGLQSPFVVEAPGGGYRMYLTMAPAGETVGQEGGNSTVWMVGATSPDMLTWTADPTVMVEGLEHPQVIVNDDGSYTAYGGPTLTRRTSEDGRTFSNPEPFELFGTDFHVLTLPDGQVRVISSNAGPGANEGGWLNVWRSVDVNWDVDFSVRGGYGPLTITVCIRGQSSSPVEIQIMDMRGMSGPYGRRTELEETAITVRQGYPPFESTITLSMDGEPGNQEIESVVRIIEGAASRDWGVIDHLMN